MTSAQDLQVLIAVVRHGGFGAAARRLGTSQSRVSRAVARLEADLGVTLLRRTSRQLALTSAGERCVELGRGVLRSLEELEVAVTGSDATRGVVRVSSPPSLTRRVLLPHLAEIARDYPEIRLELSLGARVVDLIAEDIDVAIRFGPLSETWRRARLLLRGAYRVWAAPQLVETAGTVPFPGGLAELPALVLDATHRRDRWPVVVDGELRWQPVVPRLLADDVDALIGLAVAGAGVIMAPDFLVDHEVSTGALVPLWPSVVGYPAEVFAVTEAAASPARVTTLVDELWKALRR